MKLLPPKRNIFPHYWLKANEDKDYHRLPGTLWSAQPSHHISHLKS